MLFPSDSPLQVLCARTSVSGIDGSAQQLQLAVDAVIKPIQALNNTMVGWAGSTSRFVEHPSHLRDGFSTLKLVWGWQGEAKDKKPAGTRLFTAPQAHHSSPQGFVSVNELTL